MRAGRLRYKADIYTPSTTQNALGQPSGSPTLVASVYAQVVPSRGREADRSEKPTTINHTIFSIRYRDDVRALMTIVYNGIIYVIEHIDDVKGRRAELLLTCRDVA